MSDVRAVAARASGARRRYGAPNPKSGRASLISLILDRSVGNTLEQQGPFLLATWLHAVLVPNGAPMAASLGWAYVLSRVLYPALFWAGHPWLQVSTMTGYLIIW